MNRYSMLKKSPLNYVGGKYKLLPQLQAIFPQRHEFFIDLFCGGLDVTMNVVAAQYMANDISTPIINLYKYIQEHRNTDLLFEIESLVSAYGISMTNEAGYLSLREDYNKNPDPLRLIVLISNSFNHQIRFSKKKGIFNMPFGRERCCYNKVMRQNIIGMIDFIQANKIKFENNDFREFHWKGNEFIYCDPPYQNSTAVYNRGWTTKDDMDLLDLLDKANDRGCKFALSCVLLHNGIENKNIKEWSKKYTTHTMNWKYHNSNYQKNQKNKTTVSRSGLEVCITNFVF